MEGLLMDGGAWVKKAPASVYEDSGLDVFRLVFELDRKLARMESACDIRGAGKEFKEWFGRVKEFVNAILFSGGEVVSEGEARLSMHIVADESIIRGIVSAMPRSTAEVFIVFLSDPGELAGLSAAKRASQWRAVLSGELMVAGSSAAKLRMANELLGRVQRRFEENAVEDLGELIAMDMRDELARTMTGTAQNPVLSYGNGLFLPDAEFGRMAKRAMERRRVDRMLHQRLMSRVKDALGYEKRIMTKMTH